MIADLWHSRDFILDNYFPSRKGLFASGTERAHPSTTSWDSLLGGDPIENRRIKGGRGYAIVGGSNNSRRASLAGDGGLCQREMIITKQEHGFRGLMLQEP